MTTSRDLPHTTSTAAKRLLAADRATADRLRGIGVSGIVVAIAAQRRWAMFLVMSEGNNGSLGAAIWHLCS